MKRPTAALSCLAAFAGELYAQEWTTLAGSPARQSWARNWPYSIAPVRWIASADELGRPITFEGQSGVVKLGDRVYALGRSGGLSRLFCFLAATGQPQWSSPVPAAVLESWATPSIDVNNGTVLVASGQFLTAINAVSGSQVWQSQLDRNTAGSAPAITDDLGPADRAFVADYDGFGGAGKLYCINVDPSGAANPFQPGQVVWSAPIGCTGANTPAYRNGVVYIASVSDSTGLSPGQIRAFNAAATSPSSPLWTFTNVEDLGFFGGVALYGHVYAASYSFQGGQFSANLVSVNAATGALRWSVPCNRTDATPVRTMYDSLVLSTGIRGFGSVPSIQKFQEVGGTVSYEWDSALDSWIDANHNSQMDPGEFIDIGGWTVQPVLGEAADAPSFLYVGVLPNGPSTANACPAFHAVSHTAEPGSPSFLLDSFTGAGSSPAVADSRLYTIGPTGLFAMGRALCFPNCDSSTTPPYLTANDFQCYINKFAGGSNEANCDGSTGNPFLTANDFQCFINKFAAGCP